MLGGRLLLSSLLISATTSLHADPVTVRFAQGTFHAFLMLRSLDGHALASGDLVQVVHGTRATVRLTYRFLDGSIDDETTTLSVRSNFQLISDHHTQRGPSFPKPLDQRIDVASGTVTSIVTKDGKPETRQDHLNLPADLCNGLLPTIMLNLNPAPDTRVSMIAPAEKPRLIHLLIKKEGEDSVSIGGLRHPTTRYLVKIEIGGVAGVVAPIVGKQPADTRVWVLPGEAPALIRMEGQLFEGGPIWRVEQIAPVPAPVAPADTAAPPHK